MARFWIDRFLPLSRSDLLVDAGCGTGAFLVEMSRRCQVLGLDSAPEAWERARPRVEAVGGRVLASALESVELADGSAAVVTLLDVLEHLDDDRRVLAEMARITRPGGLVVATVPALPALWSDWDVALGHRRRYRRQELAALADPQRLELLRCAYFNFLALPAIYLVRRWRTLLGRARAGRRAEDRVPLPALNWLLERALVVPACWPWFHPPCGVSLLAVWQRR